jgi:PhzF family phenazine biosynthesis protein
MSRINCWHVDAFTDRAFAGNPAAVCWLDAEVPDGWRQSVAAEMNLSETAFLLRQRDAYGLRWFTPQVEVALCGHATLASAHVLWTERLHPAAEPIRFQTQSGVLTCTCDKGIIEMDFPATPAEPGPPPEGLLDALGTPAIHIGRTRFDYLVVVDDPDRLRALAPDFAALRQVDTRGVIVTCRSDDARFDFISRFFCPAVGIDEDPVTGSAHCCLGPYWATVLDKSNLTACQASRRGGVVRVRIEGKRVVLGGQAVTVMRGQLLTGNS